MVNHKIKFVIGQKVVFISGPKQHRKAKTVFTIASMDGDYVKLSDYTRKKSAKITENNSSNFVDVMIPVHISNLMAWDEDKKVLSRIGFDSDGVRYLKKTMLKILPKKRK